MIPRLLIPAVALLSMACSGPARPASIADCSNWTGAYTARLTESDTFTGLPTDLHLFVRKDSISWDVTGEGVPEIILLADKFQCASDKVSGTFSGSQELVGQFTLTKHGDSFVFNASHVSNGPEAGRNYLGYVPIRAVKLRKAK